MVSGTTHEGEPVQTLSNNAFAPPHSDIVRVAIVDDHAAVRAGLEAALASEPGVVFVGAAADGEQLMPTIYRVRPSVVVLDYDLPRTNGLLLCRRLKRDVPAPAVLVYSAYADAALVVPAIVA